MNIPPRIELARAVYQRVHRFWRSVTTLPPSSSYDVTVQFYGNCPGCPELDMVRRKFSGKIS